MKIKKMYSIAYVNAIEYLVSLFIILDCRSVYNHAVERSYHILDFTMVLLFLMLGVGISFKQYIMNKKSIVSFFIIEVFAFVFFIINVIHVDAIAIRAYFFRFMVFLPFLILFKTKSSEEGYSVFYRLMDKISSIVVVLAISSVFFWLAGSVLHIILPTNTFRFLWGFEKNVTCYMGLYFEVEHDSFLFPNLYRNNGIFTESPMFSLVLCFALFFRVLLKHGSRGKIVTKSNICLIVAIATTFSVTGIMAVVSLFFIISLLNGNKSIKTKIVKVFLIIVFISTYSIAQGFLSSKFSSDSGKIRLNDYVIGFNAWMDAPVWGGGYNKRTYLNYIEGWRAHNVGFSNSIMWILSQGGLYLFILYIVPAMMFFWKSVREHDKYKSIFLLLVLYLYGTTSFAYQCLSLIIIGYFITSSMGSSREHNSLRRTNKQLHLT